MVKLSLADSWMALNTIYSYDFDHTSNPQLIWATQSAPIKI